MSEIYSVWLYRCSLAAIIHKAIESFKVNIFEERAGRGRSLVLKLDKKEGTSASPCLPRARPAINGCTRPDLSRRQLPGQEMAVCIKCCKISFSILHTGSRMQSLRDGVSMSARLCGAFIFCGVVAAGSGLARAADPPAPTRDIVSLSYREVHSVSDSESPPPFLARELIRQAFLIAARDECGAETRDAALREELPDAATAHSVPFDLYCTVYRVKGGFDVSYTLSHRKEAEKETLDEWKFRTDVFSPKMIPDLAAEAEQLSRTKFKTMLEQQSLDGGLGKKNPAAKAAGSALRAWRRSIAASGNGMSSQW